MATAVTKGASVMKGLVLGLVMTVKAKGGMVKGRGGTVKTQRDVASGKRAVEHWGSVDLRRGIVLKGRHYSEVMRGMGRAVGRGMGQGVGRGVVSSGATHGGKWRPHYRSTVARGSTAANHHSRINSLHELHLKNPYPSLPPDPYPSLPPDPYPS